MALITCQNLTIGYDNHKIVENISFSIDQGDYLSVIGENGAGKSTLIKTILGLLKPISGKILTGDGLKKNSIGYIPQQTSVQKDFPASCWEVVLSGCLNRCGFRPFYNKEDKKRALDNFKRLHIEHLMKESYRNLSGGQQQRVLLARALCATNQIIILDEPIQGLDPSAIKELYQIINDLNKKEGITIVMITHDIYKGMNNANKVLCVTKNVFYGTKEEFYHSKFAAKFLGDED